MDEMETEEILAEMKTIFAVRLRAYAEESLKTKDALDRVKDYEDGDYSPNRYTRSRNEILERRHKIHSEVKGYCYAADDVLGLEPGITEYRWYEYRDKAKVILPEGAETGDDGRTPYFYKEAVYEAIMRFSEHLFSEDYYTAPAVSPEETKESAE